MLKELKHFYDSFEKQLDGKAIKTLDFRMRLSANFEKEGLVLDVGCRNGALRKYLRYCRYIGLDLTRKHYDGSFTFVLADGSHIPFRDKSLDSIFALEVIEHLVFPRDFVKEAHRILKDDGNLIISVPNIACLLNRFKVVFGKELSHYGLGVGHLHCFTYQTVKTLLDEKFKISERRGTYLSLPLRRLTGKLPLWVKARLARLMPNLSDHILVQVKKCLSISRLP